MNHKIFIVTGRIRSGKTTSLFKFASEHNSVDGILAPVVDGTRKLYHIMSRTIKSLEMPDKSESTLSVGRYHFLKDSFKWANEKLIESFNENPKWLIIDELGKLELRNEGLSISVKYIIKNLPNSNVKVILVIRDYLLDDILKYYLIADDDYEILKF